MQHTLAMAITHNLFCLLVADRAEALTIQPGIDLSTGTDDYFAHHRSLAVSEHLAAATRTYGDGFRGVYNHLRFLQVQEETAVLVPGITIGPMPDQPA
jgi:hypothetical protein